MSSSATPLERPLALAGRERLTDEEVATLRERAHRIFRNGRSAFATPEGAFLAALANVETYEAQSTSSSIGMVDIEFDNRTSLVVDPPEGRIPPLTPAGRQREAAVDEAWEKKTGPEDFNTIHRCITTGVPRLGGTLALVRTATTRSCRRPDTSRSSARPSTTRASFRSTGVPMCRRPS